MQRMKAVLICLSVGLAIITATMPSVATAAGRIGPHQHFVGLVNGKHTNAVVYVACPGPVWPTRRTHPLGDQPVSVAQTAAGGGDTGKAGTQVVASFRDDPSTPLTFRRYGAAKSIPTSLLLPCQGKGEVTFTPQPGGGHPDLVTVTYLNLAV